MYVAPNTNVKFIRNCPLTQNLDHTILFESREAQTAYFTGIAEYTRDKYSFQRRRPGVIRVDIPYESCIYFNYMCYQNNAHANKWFYAFITGCEYVNEGATDLYFTLDVLQTWMFDWELGNCLVERETPAHDVAGDNILDEGLNTGDFYSVNDLSLWKPDTVILIGSTVDLQTSDYSASASVFNYDGIPCGYELYGVDTITHFNELIKDMNQKGKTDAIQFVTLFPASLMNASPEPDTRGVFYILPNSLTTTYNASGRPSKFGVYTPKNQKLLTYPYNFLRVITSSGIGESYRYEFFDSPSDIKFNIQSSYSPSSGIRAVPQNYMNVRNNIHESVVLSGYPLGSFNSNWFQNWFAQNKTSETYYMLKQSASMVSAGFQGAAAIMKGGMGLSGEFGISKDDYIAGGHYESAKSEFKQATRKYTRALDNAITRFAMYRDMQTIPNSTSLQAGAVDASISHDTYGISFQKVQISPAYAIMIDTFFSRFGYRVNESKVPTLKNRAVWDYIKTIDTDISGQIPVADLEEIKTIFENGVTFWHNAATFGDYTQDNTPTGG